MRRRAVGYVLDHPRRDLPGAVSLARALIERDAELYIIPLYDQAVDVPLLPLDAIVVNFARPANLDLVQGYRDSGLSVFVMDTEGGVHTELGTNTPSRLAELVKDRGFPQLLSGYFLWGPHLREVFVERSGMPADALITTGCPRFDCTSPRWRAVLANANRDYVLVNANYPLVNSLFADSKKGEKASMLAAGWKEDYVRDLFEEVKRAFEAFKETTFRLARDLPQIEFLVRPHPFENAETYKAAFQSLPNVEVNGGGNVLSALAGARCLVHLNCTTAIEATMLDKLPISMEFINTDRLLGHAPLPSRISAHARSYDDLVRMLLNSESLAGSFPFQENYKRMIYPWFYQNDGQAADRIAEHVLARSPQRSRPISIAWSLRSSRRSPRYLQRVQALASNLAGSRLTSQLRAALRPIRRQKAVQVPEVAELLSDLCRISGKTEGNVSSAAHPLTGLPLASIVCRPS